MLYFRKYFAQNALLSLSAENYSMVLIVRIRNGHAVQHTRLPINSYCMLFHFSRGEFSKGVLVKYSLQHLLAAECTVLKQVLSPHFSLFYKNV